MSSSPAGTDLDGAHGLFRKKLMTNCESLVRFDMVVTSPGKSKELCTLWHGSLRRYLHDNPDVLGNDGRREYLISPMVLTMSCLKYLQQPKYNRLLTRVPGSFSTHNDEDILDHHFLNYSAKYWRSHMDDREPTAELQAAVSGFIGSENFFTCLQIQSLLVDGKYKSTTRVT
jgi:hypothetical protein